jgi:hypothetical protein
MKSRAYLVPQAVKLRVMQPK